MMMKNMIRLSVVAFLAVVASESVAQSIFHRADSLLSVRYQKGNIERPISCDRRPSGPSERV